MFVYIPYSFLFQTDRPKSESLVNREAQDFKVYGLL